jgi:hypothetical protein
MSENPCRDRVNSPDGAENQFYLRHGFRLLSSDALAKPYASVNWQTAWPYFLVLKPSINFSHTVSVSGGGASLGVLSTCRWLRSPTA